MKYLSSYSISGTGPDAFFYVGKKGTFVHSANQVGTQIPYPEYTKAKLEKFTGQTIRLTLPEDLHATEIGWLSVWCRAYAVDFGHVYLIEAVNNPNPHKEIDPDRINSNLDLGNDATKISLDFVFFALTSLNLL